MIELSREQPIPVWARLVGRRRSGESSMCWALQSAPGSAYPWAVPVRLVDSEPLSEGLLRVRVLGAM